MITIGLVGLILANWQERRALKSLRERWPELPHSISGVMAMLITLFGVLALIWRAAPITTDAPKLTRQVPF